MGSKVVPLFGLAEEVVLVSRVERFGGRAFPLDRVRSDGGGGAVLVGNSPLVVEEGHFAVLESGSAGRACCAGGMKLISLSFQACFMKLVVARLREYAGVRSAGVAELL